MTNMITAKCIAASENAFTATRIYTFELEYPRSIHSEFMTHRVFGRNAQSSRAVPVAKTREVNKDFVKPIVWGANQGGMSSSTLLEGDALEEAKKVWDNAAKYAFRASKKLADLGLHKQWSNRITEPFSRIKTIVTATEWDNFFWLRNDPEAAQPEIVELAKVVKKAQEDATVRLLQDGQWHLPYVDVRFDGVTQKYFDCNGEELTLDEALKISASCCAQVSYRKLDESKEKALSIYGKLFSGPKPHLSPTEHQGMCFDPDKIVLEPYSWPKGITHVDWNWNYWSGNLKDFIQYRQII